MKKCEKCNAILNEADNFCPICGNTNEKTHMCPHCKCKIEHPNSFFCSTCGKPVNFSTVKPEEKAKSNIFINSESCKDYKKLFTNTQSTDDSNSEHSIFKDLPKYYRREFTKIFKGSGTYDGKFNWAAFLLNWFWLLYKGLWLLFVSCFIVVIPLCIVTWVIKESFLFRYSFSDRTIIILHILFSTLPFLITAAFCGNNANYWLYNKYVNRRRIAGYFGEWKDNRRNGFGNCKYSNSEYYSGEWFDDMKNGKGMSTYKNKTKYVGEWKNNKRHGFGILYTKRGGVIYEGSWENDEPVYSKNKQEE